jgi:hypothetical protein
MLAGKDWKDFQSCFVVVFKSSYIYLIISMPLKMLQKRFRAFCVNYGSILT